MLVNELKKLKLQNEVITITRDCASDDLTGIVELVNDDIVILCLYEDEGDFDGYSFFHTDQIRDVFWGNREHKAISSLIKEKNEKPRCLLGTTDFEALLKEATEKYVSICIYAGNDEDTFSIATLENMSDDWLKINCFGPKRSLSRLQQLIQLDDVTRVTVDSPYQNNIVQLHGENL